MNIIANVHFNKASVLHRMGKTDAAIRELRSAIDADAADPNPYLTLAAIYETAGETDSAVDAYTQCLSQNTNEPRANLRLGVLLTSIGRCDAALSVLQLAWASDSSNAFAANALAQALDSAGSHNEARQMYEQALILEPGLVNAYYNLGTLCYNDEQFEKAIIHFTSYIAKAGDDSRARRNIGKAQARMGLFADALKSLKLAVELDSSDPTAYYNLASVYDHLGNIEAACDNSRHALSLFPNYTDARYAYAKILIRSGQESIGMSELRTLLERCPSHSRALNALATCHLKRKEYAEATSVLREAIKVFPDFAVAHYNLGIALSCLGFEYESQHHYKESARLDQSGTLTDPTKHQQARLPQTALMAGQNLSRKLTVGAQ